MLPPVLEIYVIWHPEDAEGAAVAQSFIEHYHGNRFSGLLGGAIEVYARSTGWRGEKDAPRPIPLPGVVADTGLVPAEFVAIVPVLGNELAVATREATNPWHTYLQHLLEAAGEKGSQIGIFPLLLDAGATSNTKLGQLFNGFQLLARPNPAAPPEPEAELRCRDLSQALAKLLGEPAGSQRVSVFISHTKRAIDEDEADVVALVELVRGAIGHTRLGSFFDANDLQPGEDWDEQLRQSASSSALLALRTDLYASREWCQREVRIAKEHGMPIVVLEALTKGEERGSFLLDHVPRVPVRPENGSWRIADIRRGLNLLVDECLKRNLWQQQRRLAEAYAELQVDWWAPHAPEPLTLVQWLAARRGRIAPDTQESGTLILHPDPPLGAEERTLLEQLARLAGLRAPFDVLTPRTLAARGVPAGRGPGDV